MNIEILLGLHRHLFKIGKRPARNLINAIEEEIFRWHYAWIELDSPGDAPRKRPSEYEMKNNNYYCAPVKHPSLLT